MTDRARIAVRTSSVLAAAALLLGGATTLPAQQGSPVRFEVRKLYLDANEGIAVADVNNDGLPDIIAGRNWYASPDFVPRPVRLIEDWNGYVESNADHAYDVNGDGWVDVIAGSFNPTEVYWYQNPGEQGLLLGHVWTRRLLVDTEASQNELTFLHDIDGDGVPEWIANSWARNAPVYAWSLQTAGEGAPTMTRHVISEVGNRHGMGFGDINGDGREDIVLGGGWLERPEGDPFAQLWTFHQDWEPIEASTPMLVRDLNGDGRADLIVGAGHDYGLWWWEQLEPAADGSTRWQRHEIDMSFSQVHALHLADVDGDGEDELITGKRRWAHNLTGDPGVNDPAVIHYFDWDPATMTWTRHVIAEGDVGTGLQIRTADFNGDGRVDIAVAGKSGTYVLINQGR
ncbi:MAG TPA: VCBS repeat-containing protein [Longimicrobiales bacterium]|nr:VCBS repeat-containing protein [Longimicrobiales bacterium]